MSWLKKAAALVVLVSCSLFLTGCPGKKKPPPPPAPPPPRVGVSLAGLQKDQDEMMQKTMDSRKEKEKADVVFADAGGDAVKQEHDVADMIREKVSAVVLEAVDQTAARGLVEQLARNGIKVVALNLLPADTPVAAYVSFDRDGARNLLAQAAAAAGRRTALVLTRAGRDSPDLWTRAANAAGLGVEVRAVARGSGLKPGERPGAVLAGDATLAVAAAQELAGSAYAAGVGSSRAAFKYVSEGRLSGEVDTRPEEVGELALQAALALARGQPVPHHGLVASGGYSVPVATAPVRLITRQNFYLLDKTWTAGGKEEGSGGSGDSKGSEAKTNTLRITTEEGKTIEVHYQGKLKKIESQEGGGGSSG